MKSLSRVFRRGVVALAWIAIAASAAHAHGGIAGPDELGPPVITSTLLGIGCYYLMTMWPSRARREARKKVRQLPKK